MHSSLNVKCQPAVRVVISHIFVTFKELFPAIVIICLLLLTPGHQLKNYHDRFMLHNIV